MATIIGIDLGETTTRFGYYRNGEPILIRSESGEYRIPSVVTYTEDRILIDHSAAENAHKYSTTSVYSNTPITIEFLHVILRFYIVESKRLLGLSFNNPQVQEDIRKFKYVVEGPQGFPKIIVNNEEVHPEEISALILNKVKPLAENRLEERICEAVITVPGDFGSLQTEATMDAAYMAGFETVHLITEPVAAAVAHRHERNDTDIQPKNLLIHPKDDSSKSHTRFSSHHISLPI